MSKTKDAHVEQPTYQGPNRRTVAKIQKKIVKQEKRNRVSRVLRAKSDKDAIAAWGRDLHNILLIFNVGSVGHVWR